MARTGGHSGTSLGVANIGLIRIIGDDTLNEVVEDAVVLGDCVDNRISGHHSRGSHLRRCEALTLMGEPLPNLDDGRFGHDCHEVPLHELLDILLL